MPAPTPTCFGASRAAAAAALGVVTRLTLRTRELPAVFGGASVTIKAASDAAFRRLIARFVGFYAESLLNPHWGESVTFGSDNTFAVSMVFQGLEPHRPLRSGGRSSTGSPPRRETSPSPCPPDIGGGPARNHWNAEFLKKSRPGRAFFDQRPGAPADNVWFAEQNNELGIFIHGYQSLWLPASLLQKNRQKRFVDALFAATRHYAVMLHFNKGLAGTNDADVSAAKDTAMNPAVLDAFALAIIAGGDPAAYTDLLGHPRDLAKARADAAAIGRAADALRKVVPNAGSYVSESNYFERGWQRSFWGSNYPRLLAVKQKYDPEGLFFVHHGVGSENWSADGFTRIVT